MTTTNKAAWRRRCRALERYDRYIALWMHAAFEALYTPSPLMVWLDKGSRRD